MSWVLVEAEKTAAEVSDYTKSLLNDIDGLGDNILPIMPDGIVEELLTQDELDSLVTANMSITPVSVFKAGLHMLDRVFSIRQKLSGAQRVKCGLSWRKIVFNLPDAYRIARAFRGLRYSDWIKCVDQLTDQDRIAICAHQRRWAFFPRFQLILDASDGDEVGLNHTIQSFNQQLYKNWGQQTVNMIVPEDWYMFVKAGDALSEHALYWFASEIIRQPEAAFIYSDDDSVVGDVRINPRFKPAWSIFHLNETNYIGRAVAVSGQALLEVGVNHTSLSDNQLWEALLKIGARAGQRVAHIPAVLYHQQSIDCTKHPVSIRRIDYPLPNPLPLVSIVIPTRDASEVLENCVKSVLEKTTYKNFEVILADNGSQDAKVIDLLTRLSQLKRVQWLRDFRPFNYSELNNAAAKRARGKILCFLNNDTEVLSSDWLEVMVGCLAQPDVGVVGAKLYFANNTVQHAGDVVGAGGCANHLHSFIEKNAPGYCNRALVAQDLSAVTAACMLTWKGLFLGLQGFDEKNLKVAFNDVDYCLRVRQSGHKVVWTPHAELYHYESHSRGKNSSKLKKKQSKSEASFFRKRWFHPNLLDAFYNPNFSFVRQDFVLGPLSLIQRPWE